MHQKKQFKLEVDSQRKSDQIQDEIGRIQGFLKIVVRDVTGKVRDVFEFQNVIVNNLRTQQSRLLGGDFLPSGNDPITRYIGRVAFGTSGTPETSEDTEITDPIFANISSYSYPTEKSVMFSAVVEGDVGNDVQYREAGLMFLAPAPFLAARKTFPAIYKSSSWTWTVNWTLAFV
jgi:hypothetical protein